MVRMRWLAGSELPYRPAARAVAAGNALRVYLSLVALAALCLLTSSAIVVGGLFQPPGRRQLFARGLISRMFRTHLALMHRVGAVRLDLTELDALRDAPAMVIAPNHPSMADAALILSRVPDLTCVMKAEILDNILFGSGARMAGYITNDPPRAMLRAAVDNLRAGHHLLLFPEGTRTRRLPVNELQRTVAVIARRAGVPVQAVHIETSTAFLCKGWPLWRVPATPMVYRVRLGRRFDPPSDVDAFTAQLQEYFRQELAGARLPTLPLDADSR